MQPKLRLVYLFVLIAYWLTGCAGGSGMLAKPAPVIPATLTNVGLVIGEFQHGRGFWLDLNVYVDGKPIDILKKGHTAFTLPPGNYTLSGLSAITDTTSTVSGSYIVNYSTSSYLTVDKKFEVKAGKVTNLGLFIFVPKDEKQNYYNLDNSAEAQRYLQRSYPNLAATLSKNDVVLAKGDYLSQDKLGSLQESIAKQIRQFMLAGSVTIFGGEYVGGPAGTVAQIDKTKDKINIVRIIPTSTLATILSISEINGHVVFASDDGQALRMNGTTPEKLKLPDGFFATSAHAFSDKGIVLADDHANVITTTDGGKTWSQQKNFATGVAKVAESFSFGGVNEKKSFYLYSHLRHAPFVLTGSYDNASLQRMALPEKLEGITRFFISGKNIFLEGEPRLFGAPKLYVKSLEADNWDEYSLPDSSCSLKALDDSGLRLQCTHYVDYVSVDAGKTWGVKK